MAREDGGRVEIEVPYGALQPGEAGDQREAPGEQGSRRGGVTSPLTASEPGRDQDAGVPLSASGRDARLPNARLAQGQAAPSPAKAGSSSPGVSLPQTGSRSSSSSPRAKEAGDDHESRAASPKGYTRGPARQESEGLLPPRGGPDKEKPRPSGQVSLNSASASELEELPGVGPVLASRILEHRAAIGSFRQADELLDVPGIGPKKLERIKPLVKID